MIIYSEILEKAFDTVDECLDAELEYKRAEAKAKKEAEELQKAKDEAYDEAIKACEKYLELCGIEIKFEEDVEDDPDFIELILDMLD